MAMTEKRLAYPEDTMTRIATYLATKPYAEVHSLMREIQTRFVETEHPLAIEKSDPPKGATGDHV